MERAFRHTVGLLQLAVSKDRCCIGAFLGKQRSLQGGRYCSREEDHGLANAVVKVDNKSQGTQGCSIADGSLQSLPTPLTKQTILYNLCKVIEGVLLGPHPECRVSECFLLTSIMLQLCSQHLRLPGFGPMASASLLTLEIPKLR